MLIFNSLWCLKKVFPDTHAKPIRLNICLILVIEPPANRMDMQRRKFPAGSFMPGRFAWLCHLDSAQHPGFVQTIVMTALVPICWASTSGGFLPLQTWHDWNSNISCDRKTMNFSSVLRLPSFGDLTLKTNQVYKGLKLQSSIGEPCMQACYSQYQGMLVSDVQ